MITIKDVAQKAGVSPATVSRVITAKGNVKKETETLVWNCIEELGFKPNILAQQLRQQRTNIVNVIVPDVTNLFFGPIIRGIENIAEANNYKVYIVDVKNSSETEYSYISSLTQKQVDGIISLSSTAAIKTVAKMTSGFPIVLAVQYYEDSTIPNVGVDNVAASKEIVNHVISLGHEKIAYITSFPNNALYRDRLTGYLRALEENRIKVDMQKVFYTPNSSLNSGYQIGKEILQDESITAICTAGDPLAMGVIKAASEMGISVPEKLSVTGFDDIEFARFFSPELTTIHQPTTELGERAMCILLDLINGKKLDNSRVILKHDMVVRGSTAPVRQG